MAGEAEVAIFICPPALGVSDLEALIGGRVVFAGEGVPFQRAEAYPQGLAELAWGVLRWKGTDVQNVVNHPKAYTEGALYSKERELFDYLRLMLRYPELDSYVRQLAHKDLNHVLYARIASACLDQLRNGVNMRRFTEMVEDKEKQELSKKAKKAKKAKK